MIDMHKKYSEVVEFGMNQDLIAQLVGRTIFAKRRF